MIYHLGLSKKQLKAVKVAFLPGDPFRVPEIASAISAGFGGSSKELAWKREFRTFSAMNGKVLITSTGIGGPSAAIVMEELSMLGVKTFIRVGTTGAIACDIDPGDLIITTGSVRLDGASTHYAPIEYPAVADYRLVSALVKSSDELDIAYHTGITASSDTFYPGQERYDTYTGFILRRFQGSIKELRSLNVINYEMESATILTLGNVFKARCAVISGVVVNRTTTEKVKTKDLHKAEKNVIAAAVNALNHLT